MKSQTVGLPGAEHQAVVSPRKGGRPTGVSPFHDPDRWIAENELAFAVRDAFPVSDGHTLVVPKRALSSTSQLSETELIACFQLIEQVKSSLIDDKGAKGFNVGVNEGAAAGQTIEQLHFHVIPRYEGDIANPAGGIRNIFPGKGDYLKGGGTR